MKVNAESFHSYYDTKVHAYQTWGGETGWQQTIFPIVTIENRTLGFRFYPHFHPYVLPLIQRLNTQSVRGLQGADTDYQLTLDGSIATMPGGTRAMLTAAASATLVADGSAVALLAGAPLSVDDGTVVTIADKTAGVTPDGTPLTVSPAANVTVPGSIPAALANGLQFSLGGGLVVVLPQGTAVTLAAATQAALSDGTRVTLPGGTVVALESAVPRPMLYGDIFTSTAYEPTALVQRPYPVDDLDFTISGAYSIYNWELFFHVPLMIAIHLSQNGQYADAYTWFRYIFDPGDDSAGPTPQRFWKVNPFQTTDVALIEKILLNLSTGADPQLQHDTITSIAAWKDTPFQPFVVGRYRPTAFMFKTVMACLDNLVAWGDSLFQQYTIETINEATQLYVMAANILGPRPQSVPKKGSVRPQTYADLRASLDPFSNALRDIEVDIPFDLGPHPAPVQNSGGAQTVDSIGQALYFCIPRNDKLLAYWDTVADRLFKIHNSLNLQGVFQKLPLFDPPIDPALLVRAAAAGLDVSAIVNGLNQPLPLVRFQLLVAKATEIAQEVVSLGAELLAAMERGDNEALAMLRSQHETIVLGLEQTVKYAQWQEAIRAREGLEQSLANAAQRYTYYQKLLGMQDNQISIPSLDSLDAGGLDSLAFSSSEPQLPFQPIAVDISQDSPSVSDGAMKTLSSHEVEELQQLSNARYAQITANASEALGSGLALVPQFKAHAQPMGCGATIEFGGQHLHSLCSGLANAAKAFGDEYSFEATNAARLGSYARRELDWTFQGNMALGEVNLIFKQLRAAQIREATASKEFDVQKKRAAQAQEVQEFLADKDTNQAFYTWQKREVKQLYNQAFQLAFATAKKAERAMQAELGDPSQTFVQFSYLDGIEGLLAGEKLTFDIRRMEMAYHDLNEREYEITRHVSLLQVAPLALLQLRATGSCTVSIPEEVFDLDCPGHYFRRIKSVAVSIPCVTGPYTGINCTLTLLSSSIRMSPDLSGTYARSGADDPRFSDYYGAAQSIVTSSGQDDSGLFETNLHDERYLPFELSGAISQWQFDLPADVRQFDFGSIADVILHVRYTAREGGAPLKGAAVKNLQSLINAAQTVGSIRLFSVRHEFPTDWARFKAATIGGATATAQLSLTFLPQHYPYWAQAVVGGGPLKAVELIAELPAGDTTTTIGINDKADKSGNADSLNQTPGLGSLLSGFLTNIALPAGITDATHAPLTLYVDDNAINDLWLAVKWGK